MKTEKLLREILLIVLTLLPVAYLAWNWNMLPDTVPVHFDAHGQPNGFGSKMIYVWLPIGLYFLLLVLPKIDPRKDNYALFDTQYFRLRLIMTLFIGFIDSAILYGLVNSTDAIHQYLPLAILGLFMLIGNYMGSFRPNYFVGIKVPWTLNSDEVWVRTHKMAGKLWFWGSLAGMLVFLVIKRIDLILIPLLIILVVVPIVYSYIIYQRISGRE